jgi:hypothetical protein
MTMGQGVVAVLVGQGLRGVLFDVCRGGAVGISRVGVGRGGGAVAGVGGVGYVASVGRGVSGGAVVTAGGEVGEAGEGAEDGEVATGGGHGGTGGGG